MLNLLLIILVLFLAFQLIRFLAKLIWRGIAMFIAWLSDGRRLKKYEEKVPDVTGAYSDEEGRRIEKERLRASRIKNREEKAAERKRIREQHNERRDIFIKNARPNWYQTVVLFFAGSVLGLIGEEIFMLITRGIRESRPGLVWGPFSPLYGVGAVLITFVCLFLYKKKAKWWQVFLVAAAIGTLLEQLTGWSMEKLFNAHSWSYSHLPDAITQWVAWRFIFMWGLLGIVWTYFVMPEVLYLIGVATTRRQIIFTSLLAAYMIIDVVMTVKCFDRKTERDAGIPPANAFESWVDENFSDEFIAQRFQNLTIGDK